jgi:hypothetical protein
MTTTADQVWALDTLPASSGVAGTDTLALLSAGVTVRATVSDLLGRVWPVGSVFTGVVATNPGTLLGFGTWAALATGRTLIGFDGAQTEFNAVEKTGGEKTHVLTVAEMPGHTHVQNLPSGQTGSQSSGTRDTSTTGSSADALSTASTGGGGAHNTLPPYLVVYFWKRTA